MLKNTHFTKIKLNQVLVVFLSVYSVSTFAENTWQSFPLNPRLTLSASYGQNKDSENNHQENIDGMVPLWGNSNGDVYADLETQYNTDQTWLGSAGLGFREAINNTYITGAYGFFDRNQAATVFNPGIELMTSQWDGRINGYFPVSKEKIFLKTDFGDNLGIPNKVSFSGHQQWDDLFNQLQVIGTGADTDIGYTFDADRSIKPIRVHAGGYFFTFPANIPNLRGLEAGADVFFNPHLSVGLSDATDNIQKNTLFLTLKFTLGGKQKSAQAPIQNRLLDPVYRNFATSNSTGGILFRNAIVDTNQRRLERDNIWFFSPAGGPIAHPSEIINTDNCTFEHPCSNNNFDQSALNTINQISPNANFYLAPGNYNFNDLLSINSGQSIYGRTQDYTLPASAQTGLPVLTGGLDLQGNNNLDSFELLNNNGAQTAGINIGNGFSAPANITINNLHVGNLNAQQGFETGVNINNGENILIENSLFNIFGNTNTYGIAVINSESSETNTTLTAINNTFNLQNTGSTGEGAGVYNNVFNDNIIINARNNIFNLSGSGEALTGISNVLFTNGSITVNAEDNIFNINGNSDSGALGGISNIIFSSGNIIVNAVDNQFNLNENGMDGWSTGIMSQSVSSPGLQSQIIVNAAHNSFNITGNNILTQGIYVFTINDIPGNTITVNADNNYFNLTSTEPGGIIYGVKTIGGNDEIVNMQNNIFNLKATIISNEINTDNFGGGVINNLGGNNFINIIS